MHGVTTTSECHLPIVNLHSSDVSFVGDPHSAPVLPSWPASPLADRQLEFIILPGQSTETLALSRGAFGTLRDDHG